MKSSERHAAIVIVGYGFGHCEGLVDQRRVRGIGGGQPLGEGGQARALLRGVRAQGARGQHLEAFYGCLYYAALRPSEVVALRQADCHFPDRGWGRIDLVTSEPRAGRDWTDHGTARQARGLKTPCRQRDARHTHPAHSRHAATHPRQDLRHRTRWRGVAHAAGLR